MQKWEYMKQEWSFKSDADEVRHLDAFGKLGWQLVQIIPPYYYFKRPLPDKQPACYDPRVD